MYKDHKNHKDLMEIKKRMVMIDDKQRKVARTLGISEVYLSYIMTGKRPLSDNMKEKLWKYFNKDRPIEARAIAKLKPSKKRKKKTK